MNVVKILLLGGSDVVVKKALHHFISLNCRFRVLWLLLENVVEVIVQPLIVVGLEALLIRVPIVLDCVVTAAQQFNRHIGPMI